MVALVVYAIVRCVLCVVQALSDQAAERLADVLAWVANDLLRIRRKVILGNLALVFPALSARQLRFMSRRMWRNLVLMGCEVAQAPRRINRYSWRDYIDLFDMEQLVSAILRSRPTILLSGHFGNFEIAGFAAGLFGFPSFTVARPLDNRYLNTYFNSFRALHGQFILPKKGITDKVLRLLDSGAILTVLGDQADAISGIRMPFLGRPASCHKAIALFALNSNADMIVATAVRRRRTMQFQLRCVGVLNTDTLDIHSRSVKSVTGWYNDRLADEIMQLPSQYWWLHRRWKPKRQRRLQKNKEKRDRMD
ncbi:MAG: lysophospholipid acyltransferase family protein [Planctomycetota bacterium]|nr:lysophospholipid acyltransferase family protein [Planctomycetota bacterium]